MAEKVHAMERRIRIPDEPGAHGYWQTVCGIRLAAETASVTTSDDKKSVTCALCLTGGKRASKR